MRNRASFSNVDTAMSYIRTSFLADLVPILEENEVDIHQLLGPTGLDASLLLGVDKLITLDQHNHIISLAAHALNLPHIGLICAERQMIDIFGPLVFSAAQEDTVGEALIVIVKYLQVLIQDFQVKIDIGNEITTFSFEIKHASSANSRYFHEHALALAVKIVRIFAGQHNAVHSAHLCTAKPVDLKPYDDYFCCPITFSDSFSGLRTKTELLGQWISPGVSEWMRRYRIQVQKRFKGDFVRQVERVLEIIGNVSEISLPRVASTIGVSTRSLQRKLKEHNTRFQDIVDQVICSLACQHLLQENKVTDIAIVLGFTDVSSFSRFFKRVTKTAPTQWRDNA